MSSLKSLSSDYLLCDSLNDQCATLMQTQTPALIDQYIAEGGTGFQHHVILT